MSPGQRNTTPAFTRYDLGVSPFWETATKDEQDEQRHWQSCLMSEGDMAFADGSFISPLAAVYADRFTLGARSYVAAHVCLWGEVQLGADCTLNPFSELRGNVILGDGVRVGAHTSILGFNHAMSVDSPIYQQPLTSKGIVIGDDVWVGSHVVVVDGVSIGAHSIIGAGSVVTKDVPEWSIMAGNPAKRLRDRRGTGTAAPQDLGLRLHTLAEKAREQADQLLGRCWDADAGNGGSFVDIPGDQPTLRAWGDAVELYDILRDSAPTQISREKLIEVLRAGQDPRTGLTPEWHLQGEPGAAFPTPDGHAAVNYNILSAGYALELLGSQFRHPIRSFQEMTSRTLRNSLARLPWEGESWRSGAWVDAFGTALYLDRKHFAAEGELEFLFGWLTLHCDPATGLWGQRDSSTGLLESVNGTYRLTRGTYAQFGVPLPYAERTIDSVLAHSADANYFGPAQGTACNVLDVIHPLWLAAKQTGHRRRDAEAWVKEQLERVLVSWNEGAGFSFTLQQGYGPTRTPGLLGTEMWLSITWLLADYLGISDALGYRPRGIHRPEPASPLAVRP
jgi:carbonic anhydrase/acetyltransferase-like protein (isoleucine patch superfamily)